MTYKRLRFGQKEPKFCGLCGRPLRFRTEGGYMFGDHAVLACPRRWFLFGEKHDWVDLGSLSDWPQFDPQSGQQVRGVPEEAG